MSTPEHFDSDGVQLAWDSVSLRAFKRCPRFYQHKIIEGLQQHGDVRGALEYGILFHKIIEYYHKNDRKELDTLRYALIESVEWIGDDSARSRQALIDLTCHYMIHWRADDVETLILENQKKAIELSFKIPIKNFVLCGHIDRVGKFQNKLYVIDLKTTKSYLNGQTNYFDRYKNDVQMTIYTTGAELIFNNIEIEGAIIDACQTLAGTRGGIPKFQRALIERHTDQKEELLNETIPQAISVIKFYKKTNFPMNQTACFDYNSPCEYLPICIAPKRQQEMIKKTQYFKNQWKPLEVR